MKRGLYTFTLLVGPWTPAVAWAQAASEPAPVARDEEKSETTAESGESGDSVAQGEEDSATPTVEPTLPSETTGPVDPTKPLNETGPPEPAYRPELEPEVFWEGDADPHNPGYVPGYGGYRGLGMSPNLPQASAMPGGMTAPAGSDTWDEEWAFHFHGYLESTLRAAFAGRENPVPGQSSSVLHATPIVPGRYGDFEATQAVPGPWTQMNFSYGNPYVTATAIIAGFNQGSGASYNYPSSQLGINDVYLTLRAPRMAGLRLRAHAGAFQDRYGAMAQYSEGNYGHSIIAYTRGTGVTVAGDFDLFDDVVGLFELGVKGSLDKPPVGIEPNDANAFADAQNGAGYVVHGHFGFAKGDWDISGHWLGASANDDRLPLTPVVPAQPIAAASPDGRIDTFGVTIRAIGEPYGHLFLGGGHTIAKDARNVPRVINILNADGGRGLMEEYLGMRSGGNGSLTHIGFQYDVSLQKIRKYPAFFPSNEWDVRASFFGTYAHVLSAQDSTNLPGFEVQLNDVHKLKLGTELTYNFVEWMGVSARYDFVGPNLADGSRSFHILSPRLFFRTAWLAHEQINIRYTRWFYGDRTLIQTVAPNDPQGLDENMVALQANLYW